MDASSYSEGSASHTFPESCVGVHEGVGEALTGAGAGRVLSSEILTFSGEGKKGKEKMDKTHSSLTASVTCILSRNNVAFLDAQNGYKLPWT